MKCTEARGRLSDTYKLNINAAADRQLQLTLVEALSASPRSLRRDECGAWRVTGSKGHIYTWTWVMYVASGSARKWAAVRKRLSFCHMTQNGDDEGCFRLLGLPTAEHASLIREVLGLRKRRSANQGSYGSKTAQMPIEAPEQPEAFPTEIHA